MKILFLTRYGPLGASSRVRALQFLPTFERMVWTCDVSPLFSDVYVQALYAKTGRMNSALVGYLNRLTILLRARRYDLLWIEKELLPFLPALAERLLASAGISYVVDYDDAWFHRYDRHHSSIVRKLLGRKIDAVMRHARVVVAGNRYIAARAEAAGVTTSFDRRTAEQASRVRSSPRLRRPTRLGGGVGRLRVDRTS